MTHINDFKLVNLEEKYLEIVFNWRNTDRIRSVMNNDEIIQLDQHYQWYTSMKKDSSKIVKLLLYKNTPVGLVQFSQINNKHGTCEWGFYIGDTTLAPRGSGKMMGILALDYLFNEVKMRKICASILDFNNISINYHKKLGFLEEGRLVKHILKNNEYVDLVLMSLFKERWDKFSKLLKEEAKKANERDNYRQ